MIRLENFAIRPATGMGSPHQFSSLTKIWIEPHPGGCGFYVSDIKDHRVLSFFLSPDQIELLYKATR